MTTLSSRPLGNPAQGTPALSPAAPGQTNVTTDSTLFVPPQVIYMGTAISYAQDVPWSTIAGGTADSAPLTDNRIYGGNSMG